MGAGGRSTARTGKGRHRTPAPPPAPCSRRSSVERVRSVAGGGVRLSRRSGDAWAYRSHWPRRHGRGGRLSGRGGRLQGQAGGHVPVHGPLDARQAARGLRGGDRRQPRQCARRLSGGGADRQNLQRARDRRSGRGGRVGLPHAPVRRERDARPDRRTGRARRRSRRQARRSRPARPCAGPQARRSARGRRARDLYRTERRRLRPLAGPLPACRRSLADARDAARLRGRAADAAQARARRFCPTRPRRPASQATSR